MVTGTGQPGGFPGRVGPGPGPGSNFGGPETLRVHRGSANISLQGNWTWLLAIKGVKPSRHASAGVIRSLLMTRGQPVDPRVWVWVFRVRVRVDCFIPKPGPVTIPNEPLVIPKLGRRHALPPWRLATPPSGGTSAKKIPKNCQ
ncbi:hypothetical protein GGX14DRAFT_405058 [Mycena pura]|uniref:Uncharacterized protein n=1 Tax=Mycena pura TaxID=153505 RepID=A0AAD6UZU0_9AGAR|nr:hypothetical protein GGX14DRAFT_405058 [Mycena pura]